MKSTALCLAVALGLFCGPVQAGLLSYQNFSGQLTYDALNIGPLLPDVPLSLVGNSVSDSLDSGQMMGEDSVRSYGGFASASIDASFLPTGFSFDLQVFSGGACLANNSTGSCPAGTTTSGEFEISFTPDADTPLYVSGNWTGGNGGGVSLVDFFSIQLLRETANPFNPEELIDFNTNQGTVTGESGTLSTMLNLLAGNNYTLKVRNQTNAISSNEFPAVLDQGSAVFFASTSPVPEPSGVVLVMVGMAAGACVRRRA